MCDRGGAAEAICESNAPPLLGGGWEFVKSELRLCFLLFLGRCELLIHLNLQHKTQFLGVEMLTSECHG